MIEHIVGPRAELDFKAFSSREFLHDGHIEVVDVVGRQRVAAGIAE